jgi:phage major head subunit gpT-like protein
MDLNFAARLELHRTISGAFREAYNAQQTNIPPEYTRIATTVRSGSSLNYYDWFGTTGGMREWVGDAVFEQLASGKYTVTNRKFQKGLKASRDQMVDDAGGLAPMMVSQAAIIGGACATHPDELVIGEQLANADTFLCHDGQPMIDDSHPNQNGDGGTQDNEMGGSGTRWFLADLSKPLKPLIYQLREALTIDRLSENSDHFFTTHEFLWNAWMRDAAAFGPWWTIVGSKQTLNETNYVAARAALEGFHMGVKDPLTGTYRPARNRATTLIVPFSLRDTAAKLFAQTIASDGSVGVSNYLSDQKPEIIVSRYL